MDLIICLTTDKHIRHVHRLINDYDWDRIFILTKPHMKDMHKFSKAVVYMMIDNKLDISDYVAEIIKHLPKNIFGEMAVNLVNGNGKDHMAMISALMKSGISFRLFGLTRNGVEEV